MLGIFRKNQKNIWLSIFLLSIVLGIFFRVWNFDDWVHVKADQVRDAKMISHSFADGVGELPLLGPKAGGTDLRLGPIFYYFQYVSSVIFSSVTPPVLAYPNLFFSLLAIPLFYFFFLLFFSRFASASLTVVFSLSFLAVEYSRFAWNPNSTVFFSLLFFYALSRIFFEGEKRREMWVAILAVAFSVASQLHFVSLLGLLASLLIFLILQGKSLKKYLFWKDALIFFPIIIFFYLPVIISEFLTKGDNFRQFLEAVSGKSSNKPLLENVGMDIYYFGKYFFRIMTGYLGERETYYRLGTAVALLGTLVSLLAIWGKEEKIKNAARVALAAFLGFFVLFIPLANSIDKPRFYLSIFWIPLIFLGIIFEYFSFFKKPLGKAAFILSIVVFSLSNIFFNASWFLELQKSDQGKLSPEKTVVLRDKKDPIWLPWGRQVKIAEIFSDKCSQNKIYFSSSKPIRDFWKSIELAFYLDPKNSQKEILEFKKVLPRESEACYFYLVRNGDKPNENFIKISQDDPDILGSAIVYRLKNNFGEIGSKSDPGTIEVESQNEIIGEETKDAVEEDLTGASPNGILIVPRFYWKDVF
jgi:hypothetical protein